MTYTLLLLMSLAGDLGRVDKCDIQLEQARVNVLMWMLDADGAVKPSDPDKPDDGQGDETHKYCEKCHGTKKVKSGDGILDIPCPCGKYCHCKKPDNPEPNPGPGPAPGPDKGPCGKHCRCQQPCTCGLGCRCDHCPVGRHNNRRGATAEQAPMPPNLLACADLNEAPPIVAAEASSGPPTRQLYIVSGKWCIHCIPVKAGVKKLELALWDVSETDTKALIAVLDFDEQVAKALRGFAVDGLPTILVLNNGLVEKRLVGAECPTNPYDLANLLLGDADKLEYKSPKGKTYNQTRQKPPVTAAAPLTQPVQNVTVPVQTFYYQQYYSPAQYPTYGRRGR